MRKSAEEIKAENFVKNAQGNEAAIFRAMSTGACAYNEFFDLSKTSEESTIITNRETGEEHMITVTRKKLTKAQTKNHKKRFDLFSKVVKKHLAAREKTRPVFSQATEADLTEIITALKNSIRKSGIKLDSKVQ